MRIFYPVKEYKKGLLASCLRPLENLLCRVVGFRSDERDHTLVISGRHQTIECGRWFNVDRDTFRFGRLDKIAELSISPQNQ
jgi:hypothetical protein